MSRPAALRRTGTQIQQLQQLLNLEASAELTDTQALAERGRQRSREAQLRAM